MTIPADSALWAHGRLSPYSATRFNVEEAIVPSDARVEVFADGIAVWSRAGSNFVRSHTEARDFLGLIVAAYTVRTGIALDFSFTGWVEATEATFKGTIIGFTVPRGHRHADPASKRSRDMRVAIEVAGAAFAEGSWRLSLRDVHAAYLSGNDDSFVFAYRAIEDLARAVSQTGKKSWPDLNAHLGLTKQQLKARTRGLFDARNAVAHGDIDSPVLVAARANQTRTISVARKLVRQAFANEPTLPAI